MDIPEPEPSIVCDVFYTTDEIGYFLLFFGAGIGWFVMGYLISDCCYFRNRLRPNQAPILAESIN